MDSAATGKQPPVRRRRIAWAVGAAVLSVPVALLPHLDLLARGLIPIAQALVPVGAIVLVALAVASAFARAWEAALIAAAGAVLAAVPTLTPLRPGPECVPGASLTVLSFNAKFAGADPAQLAGLVRSSATDIVVLLETDEALIDALLQEQHLAPHLPYRTRDVTGGAVNGSVILSSFPLRDEEDIPGSVFDQVSAVAALPGGENVRVAAVHPPPPVWQPEDWHDAIASLTSWVRRTPDTGLIVAGDLNASFAHPVFRELAEPFRSAAEAAGPIPWPTWPQEKPVPAFTAIDHVLARNATPTGWDSAHIEGSDHRAVIADWSVCPD